MPTLFYGSDSSSSIEAEDHDHDHDHDHHSTSAEKNVLLSRLIIHLDVDCFYCQCEEIRNPSLRHIPIAVGQKHIIVTSNYVARKMGVQKLMGREDAMKVCPSLTIVEGSDLEPYRDASRKIYVTFRSAIKRFTPEGCTSVVRKGGMDEYFADVTSYYDCATNSSSLSSSSSSSISMPLHEKKEKLEASPCMDNNKSNTDEIWVYGNDSDIVKIREDQSGAASTSQYHHFNNNNNRANNTVHWGTFKELEECANRLHSAAWLARKIQMEVKERTGYSTTVGVSVSPMLAKLASDLKKPNSCNILYPWRIVTIINSMPLRRIPDLGATTFRTILPCLQDYNAEKKDDDIWMCQHLLRVPPSELKKCLEDTNKNAVYGGCDETNEYTFCDLLVDRCKGIDKMPILDDGGGLSKQISVEDSFVRGSMIVMREVRRILDGLFVRLLRLLDKRREDSPDPKMSYPSTFRLTARIVDRSALVHRRRPFRTISKQCAFNGKLLMGERIEKERISLLKRTTEPLLQILTSLVAELNVTRLNLAVTSFADVCASGSVNSDISGQPDVSTFFNAPATTVIDSSKHRIDDSLAMPTSTSTSTSLYDNACRKEENKKVMKGITTSIASVTSTNGSRPGCPRDKDTAIFKDISRSSQSSSTNSRSHSYRNESLTQSCPRGMDPAVFAALPQDLRREVLAHQQFHSCDQSRKKKKSGGIESFFPRK